MSSVILSQADNDVRSITSPANGNLEVFVEVSIYMDSLGIEIILSRLVSICFKDSVMDVYMHSMKCTINSLRFKQVIIATKMDEDD